MQLQAKTRLRNVRPELRKEILSYCIATIRQRGEISSKELTELVNKKFNKNFGSKSIANLLRFHTHHNGITKYWHPRRNSTIYTIKGRHKLKTCDLCGKPGYAYKLRGRKVCPSCYNRLETIAAYYMPLEVYAGSQQDRDYFESSTSAVTHANSNPTAQIAQIAQITQINPPETGCPMEVEQC